MLLRKCGLAGATRTHAWAPTREVAKEIPHAVEETRLRFGGRSLGVGLRRGSGGGCGDSLRWGGVYVPAKNSRWAEAHFAHQEDRFGIGIGRRNRRIRIETERRHDDGVDGLFLSRGLNGIVFLHLLRLLGMVKDADLSQRGDQASSPKIARTVARTGAK